VDDAAKKKKGVAVWTRDFLRHILSHTFCACSVRFSTDILLPNLEQGCCLSPCCSSRGFLKHFCNVHVCPFRLWRTRPTSYTCLPVLYWNGTHGGFLRPLNVYFHYPTHKTIYILYIWFI